jgi:hypothetical protein
MSPSFTPLSQAPLAPQWERSVFGFTQVPPQSICPAGQSATQPIAEQACPIAQALSQAPQCAGSRSVSTHWLPQTCCPLGQSSPQVPPEHFSPDAQVVPSLLALSQAPLAPQ